MIKKLLGVSFFVFTTISYATNTVDGNAFLENQTDHSGIQVLFERTVPSSSTDTSTTAASGYFTAQLENGIYDITYSKDGFVSGSITDQTLFANTTLSDVTLLEHNTLLNVPAVFSTIQTAIDAAVDGDTVLVQSGTYIESINYNGKNIVVGSLYLTTSDTSYISSTIIDGNEAGSVVTFSNDETSSSKLIGFTIQNGSYAEGGGIYCENSQPTITNCTISGNTANYGGGIYCYSSSPTLTNVTISGNTASYTAGGIWCVTSDPTLTNVTISGNTASMTGGGIIFSGSNPTLTNVTISGNTAGNGGGIYCSSSSLTLTNVTISGNTASMIGGGIYFEGDATLTNVTISGNTAGNGGGIYCYSSSPTLTNVTISSNTASDDGGGIYFEGSSSSSLVNTIVSDNTGNYGIYVNSGTPSITYSDLYNNEDGNCYGCGDWVGVNVMTNANGDSCDLYYNIQEDPLFVDPDNGDYNLQEGSPCIDGGDPTSPLDPDGSIVDMGAFPSSYGTPPIYSVIHVSTTGSDSNDGSEASPYATIQKGIDVSSSNDTVLVQSGTYVENINYNGMNIVVGSLFLTTQDTSYISSTIIDGNESGSVVTFENEEDTTAILTGFTLTNGTGATHTFNDIYGGGIFCYNSSPTLTHVTISGNTAEVGGGGIYYENSNPTLTNVTISGNTAVLGGGIYLNASNPTHTNVNISGNTANYRGGGIYSAWFNSILTGVTVSGNTADYGGGIYFYDSNPTLTNVTISGNTASNAGGGIYFAIYSWESTPTIINSIIWNNIPGSVTAEVYEPIITYSDIEGGYTGIGNIDTDPLFCNSSSGDYYLADTSPCVGTGENGANMGALEVGCWGGDHPQFSSIVSPMADGLYHSGETISVYVFFSEEVTVTGTPQLTLETGAIDGVANYVGILPGNALIFNYTITSGDETTDLDYTGTDAFSLNGGTVKNAAGIPILDITLPEPGSLGSLSEQHDIMIYGGFTHHVSTVGSDSSLGSMSFPFATIQAGIDASSNGHTVLVQSGTYVENINYNGKNIVVGSLYLTTSDTSYISSTIIDGNESGSVVTFENGEDSTTILNGFTLTNGNTLTGGGILCEFESSPTLKNLIISNNTSSNVGGGISINESNPIIQNVTVDNNTSDQGGGIYTLLSDPVLSNVIITNNSAQDNGGGIKFHDSNPTLTNVTINGNTSWMGGGIFCSSSNSILTNVTISGNTASEQGGGIFCSSSNSILTNVTISGNTASSVGGGIYFYETDDILANVTISGNTAIGGGGIYFNDSNPTLTNVTISGNTAGGTGGGGMYLWESIPTIINSIIWNNNPDSLIANVYDPIINYSDIEGGYTGTGNIDADPLFADTSNDNYTLQWGSPAIDAGDPDLDGDGSDYTTDTDDQDPDGTRMDMGAYYFNQNDTIPPDLYITSLSSTSVGTEDSITVFWEVGFDVGLDTALIELLYTDTTILVDIMDPASGQATFDVPDSSIESFQIVVTVWDFAHNVSSDTTETISVFDNTSPVVTVLNPQSGYSIPENTELTVTWNATDNISLDNIVIYYSNDGGNAFTQVGEFSAGQGEGSFVIPPGFTTNAQLKLVVEDIYDNTGEGFSDNFTVTDNTPPTVELLSPVMDTELGTGTVTQITWLADDNDTVDHLNLEYMTDALSWTVIAENEVDDGEFDWLVPNTPSNSVSLRVLAFDPGGRSDTSQVENLSIIISYPVVTQIFPSTNQLTWRDDQIMVTFSQAMDSTTFSMDNITIQANHSGDLNPAIRTINSAQSFILEFPQSFASLDTVTLTLSSEMTNVFGFELDGDGDEVPGGDYSFTYNVGMLADYDTTGTIDALDLATIVQALDEDDYYNELGPVTGTAPHFTSILDSVMDIEDVMAFVMMWNWYVTNNGGLLRQLANFGEPIDIEATHDSLYFDLPQGVLAYEVQVEHNPEIISFGTVESNSTVKLQSTDKEVGLFNLINAPNEQTHVSIPINISGKEADITFVIRAIGYDNRIISQQTSKMTVHNIPEQFALHHNYPNPFNPVTTIQYDIPVDAEVILVVYDILGRHVKTLIHANQTAGYKSIRWNGINDQGQLVSAGMYFYYLQTVGYSKVRKMVLLK